MVRIMDFKLVSIFLVIFFLAVTSVSAVDENITGTDDALSITDENSLTLSDEAASQEDNLSVSDSEEAISAAEDENLTISDADDEISIAEDENLTVSRSNDIPVSVSLASASVLTSADEAEPALSLPADDVKLTGIYDKVYSTKKWKTVKLTSFKVKKSWSKAKRDKKINRKYKAANKKLSKVIRKYTRKGWAYEDCLWTWQVGTYKVSYQYSARFYKTVYYDAYGNVY